MSSFVTCRLVAANMLFVQRRPVGRPLGVPRYPSREFRPARPSTVTISAMSAADKPPEQTMDHGYAFKKSVSHADECVRLAGLTDDLIVRDQLLDLAQEWMLAARRAHRPSDDTRVVSLHTNQDNDDGSPGLG